MAADDEKTPEPDPWADIVADGLDVGGEEISFQFEADDQPAGEPPAPQAEAADASATEGVADDREAQAWLAEPEAPAEPSSPIDSDGSSVGDGGSAVAIGTGLSGIEGLEAEADANADEATDDLLAAVENEAPEAEGWGDFGTPVGGEAGEVSAETATEGHDESGEFSFTSPDADDAAVAPVAAAPSAAPRGARPSPRKQAGGIGQMIGVVAGGVLAIPITLAILLWGLQQDPFRIAKLVPEQAAFLLPQKFQPGFKKAKAAPGGSPLDAVVTTGDVPIAAPNGDDAAGGETAAAPGELPAADVPLPDLPDLSADVGTDAAPPDAAAADAAVGVDAAQADVGNELIPGLDAGDLPADGGTPPAPGLDELAAVPAPGLDSIPAAVAVPAEPPPLDTAELDAALAEAGALGEALAAVEDRSTRPAKLLLAQWYQSLARVAERLANLERIAADSGRPLSETPEQVRAFHVALVGRDPQASDLARVAWDWLAYRKRQGDGVVLPVTFESARRLGPYWSASATLDKGDGTRRELSIVSRSEPSAVAGDRLLVTGLVLGDGVIWAADWHATAGGADEAAAPPESEAQPAPF